SGRWSQWRWKGADGPGVAQDDLWMQDQITRRLMKLYAEEGGPSAESVTKLDWNYGDGHPDVHAVAKEINGYDLTTGKLLPSFGNLKDDGTTSSGNWLYCASYTNDGNMAARRSRQDAVNNMGLYPKWAWCWPVNRRIIYNRASVDLDGNPWDAEDFVIRWTGEKWEGDVPDGGWKPMNMEGTRYPFIMKPQGFARIFGPGRAEGPFPEHYEPLESPVSNLFSGTQQNPAIKVWRPDEIGSPDEYPIVATTYRVTEHWQAGQMTRNLPWLVELMPQMFIEMSEELAEELGVKTAELVTVESLRGKIQAVAIVTKRFKPFQLNGKTVHQIGLPWHWGFQGLCVGDSANDLSPYVGDANTMIPEYKAFLVRVKKGGF
ncbi:MAG: formate dehydrogenase, partial [Anaerolineae bacterium]|nr:formate dehydrogenase [Anaerolineae bacterium]